MMWDINADLLKNPFDPALKVIAIGFGNCFARSSPPWTDSD